jgi:hypothetical protein
LLPIRDPNCVLFQVYASRRRATDFGETLKTMLSGFPSSHVCCLDRRGCHIDGGELKSAGSGRSRPGPYPWSSERRVGFFVPADKRPAMWGGAKSMQGVRNPEGKRSTTPPAWTAASMGGAPRGSPSGVMPPLLEMAPPHPSCPSRSVPLLRHRITTSSLRSSISESTSTKLDITPAQELMYIS